MSEMESFETRSEAGQARSRTVARVVQITAVVAILGGLWGAIYSPRGAGLVVAFVAFVVYLVSDGLGRR